MESFNNIPPQEKPGEEKDKPFSKEGLLNRNFGKQREGKESVKIVPLTREEFDQIKNTFESSSPEDKQKTAEIMESKGIEYDSGSIDVEVDGEKFKINTDKNDFGTRLEKE